MQKASKKANKKQPQETLMDLRYFDSNIAQNHKATFNNNIITMIKYNIIIIIFKFNLLFAEKILESDRFSTALVHYSNFIH